MVILITVVNKAVVTFMDKAFVMHLPVLAFMEADTVLDSIIMDLVNTTSAKGVVLDTDMDRCPITSQEVFLHRGMGISLEVFLHRVVEFWGLPP